MPNVLDTMKKQKKTNRGIAKVKTPVVEKEKTKAVKKEATKEQDVNDVLLENFITLQKLLTDTTAELKTVNEKKSEVKK